MRFQELGEDRLPDCNVTVAVEYLDGQLQRWSLHRARVAGLVRNYPHVPGIDFAGTVAESLGG